MLQSIRSRLTAAFIGLALGPLLLIGVILSTKSFSTMRQQAFVHQQLEAERVASSVYEFIHELEGQLLLLSRIHGFWGVERPEQKLILGELLAYEHAFEEVALLAEDGRELIRHHRAKMITEKNLGSRVEDPAFTRPMATGQNYFGPVRFDGRTGEPLMTIAIPLVNPQSGKADGVLLGEVCLKKVWELLARTHHAGELLYIVDGRGNVVGHPDPSVVLRGTDFHLPAEAVGVGSGLEGEPVVLAVAKMALGEETLAIVAQRELGKALALARSIVAITLIVVLVAMVAAIFLSVVVIGKITRPLQAVAAVAREIGGGNLGKQVEYVRRDEVGDLALAFNAMTGRLRQSLAVMEGEIGERKAKEKIIEEQVSELATKNAELERFTYTVSHDLKSPLITIKGFLGSLSGDVRQGRYDRMDSDLKRIANAADKMQSLLEDLLELSRIGRIVNPPSLFSLHEVSQEAVELLHAAIQQAEARVVVDPRLPEVFGDRQRIREVLQNLVENALKYRGDELHPEIEVGWRREAGREIFYVRDHGIGIEEKFQEKIFGLFEKLDGRSEGTGIGLALVKRIVELHGGTIWVESAGLGQGATFNFTLSASDKHRERA